MSEDWDARRPAPPRHEIGADLSTISVDELRDRVALLEAEIKRLDAEIARKQASRDAAAGAFRL